MTYTYGEIRYKVNEDYEKLINKIDCRCESICSTNIDFINEKPIRTTKSGKKKIAKSWIVTKKLKEINKNNKVRDKFILEIEKQIANVLLAIDKLRDLGQTTFALKDVIKNTYCFIPIAYSLGILKYYEEEESAINDIIQYLEDREYSIKKYAIIYNLEINYYRLNYDKPKHPNFYKCIRKIRYKCFPTKYQDLIQEIIPCFINVTELELSNLDTIPESVFDLTNLKSLSLYHIKSKELSRDGMSKLTNLKKIYFSYTDIRQFNLDVLTSLEQCSFNSEDITQVLLDTVTLERLKKLSIENIRIYILPYDKLVNLEVLSIFNRYSYILTERINKLSKLKVLYLMNRGPLDQFYSRAPIVCNLPNLKYLYISDDTTEMYLDVSGLTNLKVLNIRNTGINRKPKVSENTIVQM